MEKLSMGEYTLVVWAAYALAAVVLIGIAWISISALKKSQKKLADLE
jgi:heme exporter protein CcmD